MLVSFSVYYSTMKVEATQSSEMPVNFQRTTRRYITDERIQNQSHTTIDGQSVSQSLCKDAEPTLGLVTRYYFLSEGYFLKAAVLSLCPL
jgi:hypothetical protein